MTAVRPLAAHSVVAKKKPKKKNEEEVTSMKETPSWSTRLIFCSLAAGTGGLIAGFLLRDWQWFSRSGPIIVVCGLILTGEQFLLHHRRLTSPQDPLPANPDAEAEPAGEGLYESRIDRWFGEMLGFYMLIVGALIWGYGDLPQILFKGIP